MYSQNNEEEIILNYFIPTGSMNDSGAFLEVGAYHPKELSNTRALVERGWFGVYVEPDPEAMRSFYNEYIGNNNIVLIQAALIAATVSRPIPFYTCGDAVGTLVEKHKQLWENTVSYKPTMVQGFNGETLSRLAGSTFKFINLDVEGNNIEALGELLSAGFTAQLWCIEHEGKVNQVVKLFEEYGYNTKELLLNPENIILEVTK